MNRRKQSASAIIHSLTYLLSLLSVVNAASLRATAADHYLKQLTVIDLPGQAGRRFDYLTIDPDDHYLLSAHLGVGLLYVIDIRTNKLLRAIPEVPGVEGVEYVPDMKKVYTSDWYENKIGVIDLAGMRVTKKISTKSKPDGSTYAESFHKLYVSDERGKALDVIDVNRDESVNTLNFSGETGMPQYDSIARKVYLNLQDSDSLVVIDPATDSVVGEYAVGNCQGNHGMALDSEHHRAFLICEGNDLLTIFDLDIHTPIVYLPVASGADVVKYDPGLKRIYVACYSGAISIFQEDDPDHFHKLEDFPVQEKVHSLAVDPGTHRVYVPEQQENGRSVARLVVYEAIN